MTRKLSSFVLAALLCLSQPGCEHKQTEGELKKDKELAWRARQKQLAVKYYSDLVKLYPDSPFTAQAKEKLRLLQPAATPGK